MSRKRIPHPAGKSGPEIIITKDQRDDLLLQMENPQYIVQSLDVLAAAVRGAVDVCNRASQQTVASGLSISFATMRQLMVNHYNNLIQNSRHILKPTK